MFFTIFNKHEYDFHNSKIMEFVGLIHAKKLGFGGSTTFLTFLSKIIQVNCMIDLFLIYNHFGIH